MNKAHIDLMDEAQSIMTEARTRSIHPRELAKDVLYQLLKDRELTDADYMDLAYALLETTV